MFSKRKGPIGHLAAAFALIALFSCTSRTDESPASDDAMADVTFLVSSFNQDTRSSYLWDDIESCIGSFSLFLFRNGHVYDAVHIDNLGSDRTITLKVQKGEYRLYALANCGQLPQVSLESDITGMTLDINPGGYGSHGGFPMASSLADATLSVNGPSVGKTIHMVRLVSKWTFSVDKSELPSLTVTGIQVRNANRRLRPFDPEGSRAVAESDVVGYGDYATESDLAELNSGGSVTFYIPENMQGHIDTGGSDSYHKCPDESARVADRSGMLTYLHVDAALDQSVDPVCSGTIRYNFYCGDNVVDDFDVHRNTVQDVTFIPTRESTAREICWQVDNSGVDVAEWVYWAEPAALEFITTVDMSVDQGWESEALDLPSICRRKSLNGIFIGQTENVTRQFTEWSVDVPGEYCYVNRNGSSWSVVNVDSGIDRHYVIRAASPGCGVTVEIPVHIKVSDSNVPLNFRYEYGMCLPDMLSGHLTGNPALGGLRIWNPSFISFEIYRKKIAVPSGTVLEEEDVTDRFTMSAWIPLNMLNSNAFYISGNRLYPSANYPAHNYDGYIRITARCGDMVLSEPFYVKYKMDWHDPAYEATYMYPTDIPPAGSENLFGDEDSGDEGEEEEDDEG